MDDGADGEPISLYCAFNELDEAVLWLTVSKPGRTTAGRLPSGHSLPQQRPVACAGRSTVTGSMPYRIYGGMRFFERQEIKERSRICA